MTKPTLRLSDDSLVRILKSARHWPADQKPSALRRELLRCISRYEFFRTLGPATKAQKARLKAMHKHASKLEGLFLADQAEGAMLDRYWPQTMPAPSKFAAELRGLIEQSGWLEAMPRAIVADAKAASAVAGSAFEWLVGKGLLTLYEEFFRVDATLYRKGRYPDFALQVLKEFGITNHGKPYSRETIIKALTDARTGRSRRKP
jgi:hypothetical protein